MFDNKHYDEMIASNNRFILIMKIVMVVVVLAVLIIFI